MWRVVGGSDSDRGDEHPSRPVASSQSAGKRHRDYGGKGGPYETTGGVEDDEINSCNILLFDV